MAQRVVLKPHNKPSLIAGLARKKKDQIDHTRGLVLSFKHFDLRQGQSFSDWEKENLLAEMLGTFHGYCQREDYTHCQDDGFKVYGPFPPRSEFAHPTHVPPDADWASMHIKGKQCVAGHVFKNIFYVVFLDKEHKFWPTQKKHT